MGNFWVSCWVLGGIPGRILEEGIDEETLLLFLEEIPEGIFLGMYERMTDEIP